MAEGKISELTPAIFWTICIGSFLGGIVKGISGFGSAIILILVWVVGNMFVDPGPLQLAVVVDCLATLGTAIPMIIMTKAMQTADMRLVVTTTAFKLGRAQDLGTGITTGRSSYLVLLALVLCALLQSAWAPVGAAMLVHLDPHIVEYVMASILVVVIIMTADAGAVLKRLWAKLRNGNVRGEEEQLPLCSAAATSDSSAKQPAANSITLAAGVHTGTSISGVQHEHPCREAPADGRDSEERAAGLLANANRSSSLEAAALQGYSSNSSSRMSLMQLAECKVPAVPSAAAIPAADEGVDAGALQQQKPQQGQGRAQAQAQLLGQRGQGQGLGHGQQQQSAGDGADAAADSRPVIPAVDANCRQQGGDVMVLICQAGPGLEADALGERHSQRGNGFDPGLSQGFSHGQQHQQHANAAHEEGQQQHARGADGEEEEEQRLLQRSGASGDPDSSMDSPSSGCTHPPASLSARVKQGVLLYLSSKENQAMLGWGSMAGSVSGLMEGLTGMGGPPIMFLYRRLDVPKEVCLGTGSVNNLMQFRLIAYITLGVFQKEAIPLYLAAVVVQNVGCVLGNLWLFRYISKQMFSNMLLALMVVCALLMFASASGLAGR